MDTSASAESLCHIDLNMQRKVADVERSLGTKIESFGNKMDTMLESRLDFIIEKAVGSCTKTIGDKLERRWS